MAGKLIAITDWKERARLAGYQPVILAKSCNVSLRRLEQVFRAKRQGTPRRWLLREKLTEALAELLQGKGIKAVAPRFGFAHLPAFSRAIRTAFGVSLRQLLKGETPLEAEISFSGNNLSLSGNNVSFSGNKHFVTVSGSFDKRQSNSPTRTYENIRGNRPSSDRRHHPSPAVRPPSRRPGAQFKNLGLGI